MRGGRLIYFAANQYWQVAIYKCWDLLDLSALRYPLITQPSALRYFLLHPLAPAVYPATFRAIPLLATYSPLAFSPSNPSTALVRRSWLSSIDLHLIETRNKREHAQASESRSLKPREDPRGDPCSLFGNFLASHQRRSKLAVDRSLDQSAVRLAFLSLSLYDIITTLSLIISQWVG